MKTKPYSFWDEMPKAETKRWLDCLDGRATLCAKKILTTSEKRVCSYCTHEQFCRDNPGAISGSLPQSTLKIRRKYR